MTSTKKMICKIGKNKKHIKDCEDVKLRKTEKQKQNYLRKYKRKTLGYFSKHWFYAIGNLNPRRKSKPLYVKVRLEEFYE